MWRVTYSVSPRTPEGGQAGKGDKPLPLHIPSYCWLPQRGGMWRVIYLVSPRTPEGGQAEKGDKPSSLHILRSRDAHTQLSLATSDRENVASRLFGKPPNPRRGTSWKRRQTSSFTHTLLSRYTYPAVAGYLQKGNCSDQRRVIRCLRETRRRGTIETQGELW